MTSADRVVVIGGGPAGLAAAIAARLAGFRPAVIERRRPPIDKACGEGIMPDGAEILAHLGARLPEAAVFPFRGVRYIEGRTVATGRFRGRPGIGVRRTLLHDALRQRAEDLGVDLLWGRDVRGVGPGGVLLDDGTLDARWVVAADGQGSPLRRLLGLDLPPRHRRFGLRRHYEVEPWCDMVEVHWATGLELYITPVAARQVCVAMLANDPTLRLDEALARFPEVRRRLVGARVLSDTRGGPTLFRRARAVARGNVALLGDASASVDAITGAGVTLALHQSLALAAALRAGDLAVYEREHRALMRLPHRMTVLMLTLNARDWLRRPALRALASVPGLFSLLLALHTRAFPEGRSRGRAAPLPGPGPLAVARE